MSFPVARNSNRTSSQGSAPQSFASKTSFTITTTIPAGNTIPLPVSGNQFYLSVSSGQLQIRPSNGIFVPYDAGTGLRVPPENSFTLLEVKNETASSIAFQLVIGFDEFIDKRLILASTAIFPVLKPTYSVPQTVGTFFVDVPDITGQEFLDANGTKWLAISRVAILVFNLDVAVNLLVQKAGATAPPASGPPITNPAVGVAYPLTTLRLDVSGNYRIQNAASVVDLNGIVSEIYNAILKPN